jgi:tetratricopeptide (TPR) repeat protein
MAEETQEKSSAGKRIMGWVGTASALIGFGASIAGGVHWYQNRRQHQAELAAQMALAEGETRQGEYPAAIQTYAAILKDEPLDAAALREQLQTAMLWAEDFHVVGSDAANAAGAQLDSLMAVLDAGLTRSKGTEAADVEAHLGWAHWLNQKIAEREFGSTAEDDLRAALKIDPVNVYANAMMGNWMLVNGKNFNEAMGHFKTAVASGKARPLVRRFELGALIGDETPGARAEAFRTADEMRSAGEPLSDDQKHRLLSFCCEPGMSSHDELVESLSSVPGSNASLTYRWLNDASSPGSDHPAVRWDQELIDATLAEIAGNTPDALAKFKALQKELSAHPGSLQDSVSTEIKSLSR